MLNRIKLGVLLLFLVACTSGVVKEKNLDGTAGVTMSFPPENNFERKENEDFSIALRVSNDGIANISKENPGIIRVSYNPSVVGFRGVLQRDSVVSEPVVRFSEFGRSAQSDGEVIFLEWLFTGRQVFDFEGQSTTQMTFEACYPYKTTLVRTICVDRDIFNTEAQKTCYNSVLTENSQGAPIAITQIEERYTREVEGSALSSQVKPYFIITLKNVGGGALVDSEDDGSTHCEEDSTSSSLDRARVKAYINNQELKCKSDGIAKFSNSLASVNCEMNELPAGPNYKAPLIVEVQYAYISTLSANVVVRP